MNEGTAPLYYEWEPHELQLSPGAKLLGKGRQRAKLYEFFVRYMTDDGDLFAKCRLCNIASPPVAYSSRTYSNLVSHLERKDDENHLNALNIHKADKENRKSKRSSVSENNTAAHCHELDLANAMKGRADQRSFEHALILLLSSLDLSFSVCQSNIFKIFLKFCRCPFSIPARDTLRHRLAEVASSVGDELRILTKEAKFSASGLPYLHITSDAWTAQYNCGSYAGLNRTLYYQRF